MHAIDRYMEFIRKYPAYFEQNEDYRLCLCKEALEKFHVQTKKPVGVLYESRYHIFIADLIINHEKGCYTYTRLLPPNPTCGVVLIPIKENRIALLKQFRHGTRSYELELPRGFSEPGLPPAENARMELKEEMGADGQSICPEGYLISDTSLCGGAVDIFSLAVDTFRLPASHEGIKEILWFTVEEIKALIQENVIHDGFTITAICKYLLNHNL